MDLAFQDELTKVSLFRCEKKYDGAVDQLRYIRETFGDKIDSSFYYHDELQINSFYVGDRETSLNAFKTILRKCFEDSDFKTLTGNNVPRLNINFEFLKSDFYKQQKFQLKVAIFCH